MDERETALTMVERTARRAEIRPIRREWPKKRLEAPFQADCPFEGANLTVRRMMQRRVSCFSPLNRPFSFYFKAVGPRRPPISLLLQEGGVLSNIQLAWVTYSRYSAPRELDGK